MTALVTKHLPLVAGAPDGIKKLRELVLELAVQGRLLSQNPDDEHAEILLARLVDHRQRQVRSKAIRAGKEIASASHNDLGFSLPQGWVPVRLGEVGDWGAGATPARSNIAYYGGKTPWFKSGELTSDLIDTAEESVTDLALKECSLRLNQPGDVLIAMYGATIGKTAILAVPATTNQAVCACTPFEGIYNRFLLVVLKALKRQFVGQGAGGAQPNISKEKIVATAIGLPPEQEQHRIVAKVDELMALCDRLEADQADADAAHAQLVQALLHSLTQTTDAADFRASWQRLSEHFHTLFTTEASIDALKQTVLQLAVMAKLVPHELSGSKAPGSLPPGWCEQLINDFCSVQGGIQKTPLRRPVSLHFPYLRVANVQRGYIDVTELERYELSHDELAKWSLNKGDLLIVEGNGSENEIGRCAIWQGQVEDCVYQNHLMRVRPNVDEQVYYLALYLNSPVGIGHMKRLAITTSGLFNLSVGKIRSIPVPLPPLAEQHRIVAKVDELIALCDQLKAQLAKARHQHAQLATVLVEQAVA